MNVRRLVVAVFTAALTAVCAAPAAALDFHVTPLVIHVRAGTNAQTITLQNTSLTPLRIQVRAFSWKQEGDAPEHLDPTDDVIFFPSLLTIGPGDSRAVRVGMLKPPTGAQTERTYRVMLQELPSLESALAPSSAAISVRLQLSIPIYIDPVRPAPKPALASASMHGGKLSFKLVNEGNAHFKVDKLAIAAYDGRGAALLSEELQSPVILAAGFHNFDVAMDPVKCAQIREITITAQTDSGTVKRSLASGADLCR